MKYKAVIFDWDGTLIDSVDHIANSLRQAAEAVGLPVRTTQAYRDIIGLGMVEALDKLYPGLSRAGMKAIRERYADFFFSESVLPSSIFPGMADLLDQLSAGGAQLAVATGKSRRGLDHALETSGLDGRFAITRCADETRSKPDPLMLHEILGHFRLQPSQAVMIGDTVYDMDMAARARMPSIGVTWGVHETEQLALYEPVQVVHAVEDLNAVLLGHGAQSA